METRPFRSSVRPSKINGTVVTLAFCEGCGTIRVFNMSANNVFPDTGHWTECRACDNYSFFYRLEKGRVVSNEFDLTPDEKKAASIPPDDYLDLDSRQW